MCHELSESGKFYTFEPDSLPFTTTIDRRWLFKQENVLLEKQFAKLNKHHKKVYGTPEAYKTDSMGYLHTTLRSIGQRIMAKAFGLEKYFVDVYLAIDHEGHFGLLMPLLSGAINADQWLNKHDYIISAAKKTEEKEHLARVLQQQKNRYHDPDYHKIANRVFDNFNLPALKVIRFIDQRCSQTDRSKLSNILLVGDSSSNDPFNFDILGIDQDLAFAHLPKAKVTGRESDPNFPFDIRPLKPCCKQWIHRLNNVLKPILPFDDQRIYGAIFDDINQVFPSLADSCFPPEGMASSSSESSPHSSSFSSGSGGRITPLEVFPDTPNVRPTPSQPFSMIGIGGMSAEGSMPLEASLGKKRPYSETLMVPARVTSEFLPLPSTSSPLYSSSDSEGTETENLPSLDSLSSIGTVVFDPTLEEEQQSTSPELPGEEHTKRPRHDDSS